MAVVVRNDMSLPFRLPGGDYRTLDPGQVGVFTEEEYSRIATTMRGPGKIVSVYPNESVSESLAERVDYDIQDDGAYHPIYVGYARQAALSSDSLWLVRKFQYNLYGTDSRVVRIQVLENVIWDNRVTLAWT